MNACPPIPGYDLLQCLGGSPLTAVFSARERATGRLHAVKVLRAKCEDFPAALHLLRREARAGLAVRHPHLVPLLDAHVARPPYFLVMELLAGESLRTRLRRDFLLPPSTAIWITRQVAQALAALHRAGFVHGDVKPENVCLIEDGKAVLIDLGFTHRPRENAVLYRRGYLLGTPNYLAPELARGAEGDGFRSDLYSLGVCLSEMLTGQLPTPGVGPILSPVPPRLVRLAAALLSEVPAGRPAAGTVVQQLIELEISGFRRAA